LAAVLTDAFGVLCEVCKHCDVLSRSFRTNAPKTRGKLASIVKSGGVLRTSYERQSNGVGPAGMRTSTSNLEVVEKEFGYLPDCSLLRTNPALESRARISERRISYLPKVTNSDEAFYWMCNSGASLSELQDARKAIVLARDDYKKLRSLVMLIPEFLSITVFERLNAWGQDKDNDFWLEATATEYSFYVCHRKNEDDVRLRPNTELFKRLPKVPELR